MMKTQVNQSCFRLFVNRWLLEWNGIWMKKVVTQLFRHVRICVEKASPFCNKKTRFMSVLSSPNKEVQCWRWYKRRGNKEKSMPVASKVKIVCPRLVNSYANKLLNYLRFIDERVVTVLMRKQNSDLKGTVVQKIWPI